MSDGQGKLTCLFCVKEGDLEYLEVDLKGSESDMFDISHVLEVDRILRCLVVTTVLLSCTYRMTLNALWCEMAGNRFFNFVRIPSVGNDIEFLPISLRRDVSWSYLMGLWIS
jgi:hypothetical protein